jgi:hypothetical protein
VLQTQIWKSIYSAILSNVLIFILFKFSEIPAPLKRKYNEDLLSNDPLFIKSSVIWIEKMMFPTYVAISVICVSTYLLCWYYVMAFCAVYMQSSVNWIYGSLTSLIMDVFVTSNTMIIVQSIVREFAKKYPKDVLFVYIYDYMLKNL